MFMSTAYLQVYIDCVTDCFLNHTISITLLCTIRYPKNNKGKAAIHITYSVHVAR